MIARIGEDSPDHQDVRGSHLILAIMSTAVIT
jgi:hypothetical protein